MSLLLLLHNDKYTRYYYCSFKIVTLLLQIHSHNIIYTDKRNQYYVSTVLYL